MVLSKWMMSVQMRSRKLASCAIVMDVAGRAFRYLEARASACVLDASEHCCLCAQSPEKQN